MKAKTIGKIIEGKNRTFGNSISQKLKYEDCGAGAMAQKLGALVALSKDPSLIPSIYMVTKANFNSVPPGSEPSSKLHQAYIWDIYIHVGKTPMHIK